MIEDIHNHVLQSLRLNDSHTSKNGGRAGVERFTEFTI